MLITLLCYRERIVHIMAGIYSEHKPIARNLASEYQYSGPRVRKEFEHVAVEPGSDHYTKGPCFWRNRPAGCTAAGCHTSCNEVIIAE